MVVTTALQYNPEDRYQSASDMKEALLGAARETGILRQVSTNLGPQKSGEDVKPVWAFQCEDEIAAANGPQRQSLYRML